VLLERIGITPDRILNPGIDESPLPAELPRHCAERLARAKAAAVSEPDGFVLAADTVVAAGRRMLPKAETPEQALSCMNLLSGRRHRIITAVVLTAPDSRRAERVVESVVGLARLTAAQKQWYLDCGEWQGKAGGYAIQGRAASFIRFISGSYFNVVGLPLFETAQLLRGLGWPMP